MYQLKQIFSLKFSNKINSIFLSLFLLSSVNLLAKVNALPTVLTAGSASITSNSVTFGGNIVSNGGFAITESGFVYSTTKNLTLGGFGVFGNFTNPAVTSGGYILNFSGLNHSTKYYFRAYAINASGTSYGDIDSFNTTAPTIASLNSNLPTNILQNSATIGGTILNNGSAAITQSGVLYGTTRALTLGGVGAFGVPTSPNVSAGTFNINISGLTTSTKYYFRAYAVNSVGTAYSVVDSFTTLAPAFVVVTSPASSITTNSAVLNASIPSNGGIPVIESGFVYGTTKSLTLGGVGVFGNFTNPKVSLGAFNLTIGSLSPVTKYYYRAYAQDANGVYYGVTDSFTTLTPTPVVATAGFNFVTNNSALIGGNILSNGGDNIIESGFVYGETSNLQIGGNGVFGVSTSPLVTSGGYSSNISGLKALTKYYFKAYAKNSFTTTYGATDSFTTLSLMVSVFNEKASSITGSSANVQGRIVNNSTSEVSESGVIYGTTTNLVLGGVGVFGNFTSPVVKAGVFNMVLTSLTKNTKYYFKFYGTNAFGIAYSTTDSFTTLNETVSLLNARASAITFNSARLNANILADGGSKVTESGFVYGLTDNLVLGGVGTFGTNTSPTIESGAYSLNVSGLNATTKYYFKAYVRNGFGITYSTLDSFVTPVVTVSLLNAGSSAVGSNSARLNANILSDGGSKVAESGFVYGLTENLVLGGVGTFGTNTSPTVESGAYSLNISGLTANTKYYFKAYVRNGLGITYSSVDTFNTITATVSILNTGATVVGASSAKLNANIVSDGGSAIKESGFVYGLTENLVLGGAGTFGTFTDPLVLSGNYSLDISGLSSNTKYYFKAYVSNSFGITYSSIDSFTTIMTTKPIITFISKNNIKSGSAEVEAEITSNGGLTITESGVLYSLDTTLNLGGVGVFGLNTNPAVNSGRFFITVAPLTASTKYYFKIFARNSLGYSFTSIDSLTTAAATLPAIANIGAINTTSTNFSVVGNIIDNGGSLITKSGVVMDTIGNPIKDSAGVIDLFTPSAIQNGNYKIDYTTAIPSKVYYFRVYAINSLGISYGNLDSVTTKGVSVKDAILANGLQTNVFPNPFNNEFSIEVNAPEKLEMSVSMMDINGKEFMNEVISVSVGTKSYNFNKLSDLKPGVYFIKLNANSVNKTYKIIKF
jgi:hypothetical protein